MYVWKQTPRIWLSRRCTSVLRYQQTHRSLWSFSHCDHTCHSAVSTHWLYASILCAYTGYIKRVITKCIHTQFGSFTSWLTNRSNKSRKVDDAKRAWLPPYPTMKNVRLNQLKSKTIPEWIKIHESMVHFSLKLVRVGMHFDPNKRWREMNWLLS